MQSTGHSIRHGTIRPTRTSGGVYVRHCSTELRKQVLPRLCRPAPAWLGGSARSIQLGETGAKSESSENKGARQRGGARGARGLALSIRGQRIDIFEEG